MKRSNHKAPVMNNVNESINQIKESNRFFELKSGFGKKYLIETHGCQMNEHDSEKLEGFLSQMNYVKTDAREEADLIIFNTCCVRENAELKIYGKLGALKHLKKKSKDLIIALCGCMMQQKHVVDYVQTTYPHVDLIFGTHNLHNFPALLQRTLEEEGAIIDVWSEEGEIIEGLAVSRKFGIKSFVNIMYGCNNFCTYCIVPYTRGRERSREVMEVVREVEELVSNGTKEVMLLGQNVNSYGKTLEGNVDFSDLLIKVAEIQGIQRIRFMTSHPKDLSEKLIETMGNIREICNHIHLPLQAGSNKVLKEMNRGYTQEEYLRIITKIKNRIPEIAITTDIIVGFPGEEEKDFEKTLKVAETVKFDSAFTFLYSKREGTPAARSSEHIAEDVKKVRFQRLKKLIDEIAYYKNQQLLNQTVEVLVEGSSKKNPNIYTGRTETSKTVNFPGDPSLEGKIVRVKILDAKTYSFDGEVKEVLS